MQSTMNATPDAAWAPAQPVRPDLPRNVAVPYARHMTVPADDTALMLRYADGDAQAFETLYRRHNDALFRYLTRLSGNRDTAADLFQEVWSKVIKARRTYRPSARFNTWLYRIAHNAFIDNLRRNKRYGTGPDDNPDLRPSQDDHPDAQVEQLQMKERLLQSLATLPDEQREAWLLQAESGLSVVEIGRVTGVSAETAKSRLRYAVRKLKQALTESAGLPESTA